VQRIAPQHVGYDYMNSCFIHDQTFTGCPGSVMGCTQDHGKNCKLRFEIAQPWFQLKFYRVVHHSALGATGKIDVGVVGVNVSASRATINAIFTFAWLEAAPAQFSVDSHSR